MTLTSSARLRKSKARHEGIVAVIHVPHHHPLQVASVIEFVSRVYGVFGSRMHIDV